MKFPAHKCGLFLSHNEHRDYYLTAAAWIAEQEATEYCVFSWVNPEQRQQAIDADEVWVLQWYPETPVGFHALAAADLDILLDAAALES